MLGSENARRSNRWLYCSHRAHFVLEFLKEPDISKIKWAVRAIAVSISIGIRGVLAQPASNAQGREEDAMT